MAEEITRDYRRKIPVMIGVLKGVFVFMADLIRRLDFPLELELLRLSSYGSGQETSGKVKMVQSVQFPLKNRDVLVVEDIVDTGLTWEYIRANLLTRRPESLKIITLLDKKERRLVDVPLDYVGFVCPDEFVIGYGLDYQEKMRNLPYIGVLEA